MATPYSVSGSVSFSPDTGQPDAPLPFSGSGSFTHSTQAVLSLTGAGSKVVDFGSIPAAGAKVIRVEVDAVSSSPTNILLAVNGSATGKVEVSPGGFVVLHNPAPTAGISSLTVEHTGPNVVRVTLLG